MRDLVKYINPVDDAKGNAEAIIAFRDKLGLKINF